MTKTLEMNGVAPVSNAALKEIEQGTPYTVHLRLEGTADLLFHRWQCEAVEEKSKAAKGSKAKKEDNVESYVWRDEDKMICLPGEYVRQAIIYAAKFRQDPRSPRKSAFDLYKAGVQSLTPLAPLGKTEWDYVDQRRVQVQRNGITRRRPAILAGWQAGVSLMVLTPEYISPNVLLEVIQQAGRLIGVGDFRPTYGRFAVTQFEVGLE